MERFVNGKSINNDVVTLQKEAAEFILSEKGELLPTWVGCIKSLGGSYSGVDTAELFDLCGEFLDAFCEILEKGNFLSLRMFIKKISSLRSSQGFGLSEVQRAYYSFYDVIKIAFEKWDARRENAVFILETAHHILMDTLFELSEAYHQRLIEKIDNYIGEIQQINVRLKELSIKDELTGCYNQRYFYESLGFELARSRRYKRPLSIVIFDIDHFKKVNDRFGHLFGDDMLKNVADTLKKSVRYCDAVFRYGGEEFAVILPESKKQEAFVIAERIRKKISDADFDIDGKKIRITISGGINWCSSKTITKENLIADADKALYSAKRQGRNKIVLYENGVHALSAVNGKAAKPEKKRR
ncbi:MAG: diguanylate cyclase [Candidatus Omnitrophica bacterium]|nr:diguanylate cyclase [Candidatus Omnitrophota bacterium]